MQRITQTKYSCYIWSLFECPHLIILSTWELNHSPGISSSFTWKYLSGNTPKKDHIHSFIMCIQIRIHVSWKELNEWVGGCSVGSRMWLASKSENDHLRTRAEWCSLGDIVKKTQSPYTTLAPNCLWPIICLSCWVPGKLADKKCCDNANRFSNGDNPMAKGSLVVSPAIGVRKSPLPMNPWCKWWNKLRAAEMYSWVVVFVAAFFWPKKRS